MPTYVKVDEKGKRFNAYPMSQSVNGKSGSGRARLPANFTIGNDQVIGAMQARQIDGCAVFAKPSDETRVVKAAPAEPKVRRERMPPPRDRVKGNRYVAWRA